MLELFLFIMIMGEVASQALLYESKDRCSGGLFDVTEKCRYNDYEMMRFEERLGRMEQNYNSLKSEIEYLGNTKIITSEYIGGSGGGSFDDRNVTNGKPITAIRLRCGNFFHSIQARYGSNWGPVHGADYIPNICDDTGNDVEYLLHSTEHITQLQGSYGSHLDSITIHTNMRTLPRCGGTGGGSQKSVSGTRLRYLKGRSGCYVDGLQPVWAV